MADFLVDTSVLIDALNGKGGRAEALLDLLGQGHMLGSCAVIVAEVYAGMHPSEAEATDALLTRLHYYDTSREVARIGGRLKYDWRRRGESLSLADVLIAATALHYGLTLVSDNVTHFPMPELRIHTLPAELK